MVAGCDVNVFDLNVATDNDVMAQVPGMIIAMDQGCIAHGRVLQEIIGFTPIIFP